MIFKISFDFPYANIKFIWFYFSEDFCRNFSFLQTKKLFFALQPRTQIHSKNPSTMMRYFLPICIKKCFKVLSTNWCGRTSDESSPNFAAMDVKKCCNILKCNLEVLIPILVFEKENLFVMLIQLISLSNLLN